MAENDEQCSDYTQTRGIVARSIMDNPDTEEFLSYQLTKSDDSGRTAKDEQDISLAWNFSRNNELHFRSEQEQALRDAYLRVRNGLTGEIVDNNTSQSSLDSEDGQIIAREFVVIRGAAGTGKTTLAKTIKQQCEEDGGFFCIGKFDPVSRFEPHAFFVQALTEFCTALYARKQASRKFIKNAILNSVGTDVSILTDLVPAMSEILGRRSEPPLSQMLNQQPTTAQFSAESNVGAQAANRFKSVLRNFLRAVCSPERPFALILDDLQYADDYSLDLISSLMTDSQIQGALFVGTLGVNYGIEPDIPLENERFENILVQCARHIDTKSTEIYMSPFSEISLNDLLGRLFQTDSARTRSLASLIYDSTAGNPLFVQEFLRTLFENKCLWYNALAHQWEWSDGLQLEASQYTASYGELVSKRLLGLPPKVVEMLKISSCLGFRVEKDMLEQILHEPVFHYLQQAAEAGIISSDYKLTCLEFAHDLVMEMVYEMIPVEEREVLHCSIGMRLWKSLGRDMSDRYLFAIVGQLMLGASDHIPTASRTSVAELFLKAGERAVQMSCFHVAHLYFLRGIECLGDQRWRQSYQLSLDLFNAAAEVACCNSQFASVEIIANEIIANAKSVAETYRAESLRVYALGINGRIEEATESGLRVLRALGVLFPDKLTMNDIAKEIKKMKKKLKGKTVENLLALPTMTDPDKLAAMEFLNLIFFYDLAQPVLSALIGLHMIKLSLDFGLCSVSCTGFVIYAMLLCG